MQSWSIRHCILAVTIGASAARLEAQSAPDPRPSDLQLELDARVPRWLSAAKVPSLAIAVIRNHAVAWTRVYGEQSAGVRATDSTLYNVASLTKPLFAEIVLRLAGERLIDLDERMSRYWIDPDLANDARVTLLTPRLALSHRTGFANWRRESEGELRFVVEPGTSFRYSGEGYEFTSEFLQRKLGASVDHLGRRWLFDPLGMRRTSFVKQSWFAGRVAMPAAEDGQFGAPAYSDGNAADDLYSTISDYATFLAAAAAHRGLPDSFARQRDSLHVADTSAGNACNPSKVAVCPTRIGHGLGWSVQEYSGGRVLWHTGADRGERALVFFFPESGDGAVLLTNGANGFSVIIDAAVILFPQSPFAGFLRSGKP